jgi:hypothetical protein
MKRNRASVSGEKKKLNKRLVRQTLHGYARANKSIQMERRVWLANLTMAEAHRIFDELHQNADDWKRFGGDLEALENRRISGKIQMRKIMARLAQRNIV